MFKLYSILFTIVILFPVNLIAENHYDILKMISPKYEKTQKASLNMEYMTDFISWENEESNPYSWPSKTKYQTAVNTFFSSYGISDSISCHLNVPYLYVQKESDGNRPADDNNIGDISTGITYQYFSEDLAYIFDFTYTSPTGTSPFKIEIYDEIPTGSGLHSINPQITFMQFLDNTVLFARLGMQYSLPTTGLSQLRYTGTLTEVKPGHSTDFKIGTAVQFTNNFSADFGLSMNNKSEDKYTWRTYGDTMITRGEDITKAYFFISSTLSISDYTFYQQFTAGLTDDSYDYAYSIRLPIM